MSAHGRLRTRDITADGKPPRRRACALVALALTCVAASARADESVSDQARQHFKAGVTLLQDPDGARYEEAYREFKTAYDLSPSPKILGNLGYCALKLERDREAIDAYERYLREATDVEAQERKQVESDLLTLKAGMVRVVLDIEAPGGAIVDRRVPVRGDPVVNGYGTASGHVELGVRSGRHLIEVKLNGAEAQAWQFDAMPGGHVEHAFTKPRPAPVAREAPSRTAPILLTSAGALMLGAGAVTGIIALDRAHRIDSACPNGVCPAGYGIDSQRSAAYAFVRATDVLLIGGGLVTATGLGWLLFSRSPSGPAAAAGCTGDGCGAAIRGRF